MADGSLASHLSRLPEGDRGVGWERPSRGHARLVVMVKGDSVFAYGETALKERASRLPAPERTLLAAAAAAACAERLLPLYEWITRAAGTAEAASVRSALDLAWSASASAEQAEQAQLAVEELVPDEDDDDAPADVALEQHAIAAVAYALATVGSHDP